MGYDSTCTLITEGRSFAGTARLEDNALTFHGDTRLAIPLAIITAIEVRDGRLHCTAGGRGVILELGEAAEKWAQRMTSPPSRLEKLGVKPHMRIGLVGLEDDELVAELSARGATVLSGTRARGLDIIFFGAHALGDLDRLEALVARIQPAGAIWLIRAKGRGAPIPESASMAAGKRAGLVDVKVVSYSNTHSAEKYVIPVSRRPPPEALPLPGPKAPRAAGRQRRPKTTR